MKNLKKIIIGSLCIFNIFILVGCSDFSFKEAIFGDGKDEIIGSSNSGEWNLKTKREVTTLINTGETLLSGSRYVLKHSTPYEEEIVDVDNALEEANTAYNDLEVLYEPEKETPEKEQTLQAITAYKEALINYSSILAEKDDELIKEAVDRLSATINDLVAYSGSFED